MRRIVVNSTPLIVLSNIKRLKLLKDLYSEIYIPKAVFDEVTLKNDSVNKEICANLDWIHVCKIQDESAKRMYQAKLHAGEVEVMILAQENPKSMLWQNLKLKNKNLTRCQNRHIGKIHEKPDGKAKLLVR